MKRHKKTSDTIWCLVNWSPVSSNENNQVLDYKIGIDPRIFTRSALVRKTTFRIRPIKRLLGMINPMMVLMVLYWSNFATNPYLVTI